ELLRKTMLPEAMKALGMKINLETINGNDLQARITAAIQSGAGPDLIMAFNNFPHVYSSGVADVSDVAEAVAKAQGGYYRLCRANTSDGKKFLSVPWAIIGAEISYRKSWFEEVGYSKFPGTISATLNGASIYIETLRKPDQYQTEKGAPMKTDIQHAQLPKGPAGQFAFHLFQSHMLMGYSRNQKAAKEFMKWIHTPANYE